MGSPDPLFVADSFGKTFGDREVLKAATAWAVPGTVTVLFGRNGSGKSTLIRAALGLIRADFGLVRYDGATHLKPRLHSLARQGLMFIPDRGLLSRRRTRQAKVSALTAKLLEATTDDLTSIKPCWSDR